MKKRGHHNGFWYVDRELIALKKKNGGIWKKRRLEGRRGLEDTEGQDYGLYYNYTNKES